MDQDPPGGGRGGGEPPRDDDARMARAFATARSRMSAVPSAVSGYRFFWVREGSVGWRDLTPGGPYVILGSHEKCDVVLPDAGIAPRHALATVIDLSDGPALRVLDLHTETPFRLQDGSPQRSIVGGGSVLARLGGTVFGAVPVEVGRAPEPPAEAAPGAASPAAPELPVLVKSESDRVPLSVMPPPGSPATPKRPPARVTVMPPSWRVSELPPRPTLATHPDRPRAAPSRSAIREIEPPAAGRVWPVTLEREGRAASVTLADTELALGVVIGRAVNCLDGGLRAVLGPGVSRGHLLLLHHHDIVEAYDLCSLNGTWEGRTAVHRRRMGDEPVTLMLSNHEPVVVHWHGRGSRGAAPGDA